MQSTTTSNIVSNIDSSDDDYPYNVAGSHLGKPPLRQWDLNENSTQWDISHAAPSDAFLERTWTVWSVLFFVFSLFNLLVLWSIVREPLVRSRVFNQYLIYLMIPDVLYTGLCAIWCAILKSQGGFMHPAFCAVQSFYLIGAVAANSWLNAIIVWEIHRLLNAAHKQRPYVPTTSRAAARRSIAIYIFSLLVASLGLWKPWTVDTPLENVIPHRINNSRGFVCVPMPYDKKSTLFFFLAFFPLFNGIPLLYSVGVALDVCLRRKLPTQGPKRELALYFFRILVVFLVMWLPPVVVLYILQTQNPWLTVLASAWGHSQGAVSAAASLLKPDIYQAFSELCANIIRFGYCRSRRGPMSREQQSNESNSSLYGFHSSAHVRSNHSAHGPHHSSHHDNAKKSQGDHDDDGGGKDDNNNFNGSNSVLNNQQHCDMEHGETTLPASNIDATTTMADTLPLPFTTTDAGVVVNKRKEENADTEHASE